MKIDLAWHAANQAPQSVRMWPNSDENNDGKPTLSDTRSVDVSALWSVGMASLSVGQSLTVELVAEDTAGQIGKAFHKLWKCG